MALATTVQRSQLFDAQGEALEISKGLDSLENMQLEAYSKGKVLLSEMEDLLSKIEKNDVNVSTTLLDEAFTDYERTRIDDTNFSKYDIRKTKEILTCNSWEQYYLNILSYADSIGIDKNEDLFLSALGESEYKKLSESINDEFAKKTSIRNKTDLIFLGIATALEVAKGLLFPLVSEKLGYGQGFDPNDRLKHDDKSIEEAKKKANDKYRDKKIEKHGKGKWINFIYSTVPYDITTGSGNIADLNLHGGAHRLYTLGHDPILGWIFGTANILTDIITVSSGAIVDSKKLNKVVSTAAKVATMRSYRIVRKPKMMITSEIVPSFEMFKESYDVAREDRMNLPAALFTQFQHLKSDLNTKMGLPVPLLEVLSPDFASKLYKEHYDALCFARDLKIIGKSAILSLLIDTIIGLVHGFYYDPQKDGSRDLYEVRTRKILLIANTIGTSSNLIFSYFTGNVKAIDIGGLLVTLAHLFCDTRFFLNVKKEFIENKIYEKIEDELKELDKIENELIKYGESHRFIYGS